MTAFNPNFLTPSDQRALQKIARMSPDQMAILGSLITPYMEKAANKYAAKLIDLRMKAFEKKRGESQIALGRERLASRERTSEADIATKKAGMESRKAIELAGMESSAARRGRELSSREALKMQDIEQQREELPYTIGLGIAKLGVGALGGEAERRKNKRLEEKIDTAIDEENRIRYPYAYEGWGGEM